MEEETKLETTEEQTEEQTEGQEEQFTEEEVEESPEESTEEETEETDEEVDFAEWLSQLEGQGIKLPENIQSPEDLAKGYYESLSEMKRQQSKAQQLQQVEEIIKARGFESAEDFLNKRTEKSEGTKAFSESPVTSHVDTLIKNGEIKGDDAISSYRSVAKVLDGAFAPQFEMISNMLEGVGHKLFDLMWDSFSSTNRDILGDVSRSDLENIIQQYKIPSYDAAFRFYATSHPEILKKLTQTSEDKGVEKFKKLKRFKTPKGRKHSTGQTTERYDFKKYFSSDGSPKTELHRLPVDVALKITDAYLKYQEKKSA